MSNSNNNNNNNNSNYSPSNNNNNESNNQNWNNFVNDENNYAKGNLKYKTRRGNWTQSQKNAVKWILERKKPINNIQRNKNGIPIEKNGSTLAITRYSIANYLRTLRNTNGKPIRYDPQKTANNYLNQFNNKSRAQIERTHLNNKTKFRKKLVNSINFVKNKSIGFATKQGIKAILGPTYPVLLLGQFIHGGGIKNTASKIQSTGKILSIGLTIRHFYYTMLALSGGEKSRATQLVIEQIDKSKKNLLQNANKNSQALFEQYRQAAEKFKRNGMAVTNRQSDEVIKLLSRYLLLVLVNRYNIKNAKNTSINVKTTDVFGKIVSSIKAWSLNPTDAHYESIRIAIAKFLTWMVVDGLGFTDPRVDPKKQLNAKAFDSLYQAGHMFLNYKTTNRTPYQKYLMGKKMGHFLMKFYQLYSELPAGEGKFKKRVIASLNKNIITGLGTAILNNSVGNTQSNRIQKIIRSSIITKQKVTNMNFSKKIELAGQLHSVYSKGKVNLKLLKLARAIVMTPSVYALKDLFVAMYLLKYGYSHLTNVAKKIGNWGLKKYGANTYNELYARNHNVNIKKLSAELQDDLMQLKEIRYSMNARMKLGIRNLNQQGNAEKKIINKILSKYDVDVWRSVKESNVPYGLTNVYNSARKLFFFNQ